MADKEKSPINVFGIIVLIIAVMVLVFLIICSVYFFNLMNLKPPSKGESTFLFWTAVIMAVIFLGLVIYAIIHIFTHKSIIYKKVCPKPEKIETRPIALPQSTTVVDPAPIRITNVPKTRAPDYSDIPVTSSQRTALDNSLVSLGASISDA